MTIVLILCTPLTVFFLLLLRIGATRRQDEAAPEFPSTTEAAECITGSMTDVAGTPVRESADDRSFATSLVVADVTDSAALGYLAGGSAAGAIIGYELAESRGKT